MPTLFDSSRLPTDLPCHGTIGSTMQSPLHLTSLPRNLSFNSGRTGIHGSSVYSSGYSWLGSMLLA